MVVKENNHNLHYTNLAKEDSKPHLPPSRQKNSPKGLAPWLHVTEIQFLVGSVESYKQYRRWFHTSVKILDSKQDFTTP